MEQWFGPPSWRTVVKALDQRSGGTSHIIMCRPDVEGSDGEGVFLEAVPQQQLVFTIAFTTAWNPFHQLVVFPFMVTVIEVSDEGG
ncbi:SRPBCC domain-containing protein [Candidatus Nitrospira salsa]